MSFANRLLFYEYEPSDLLVVMLVDGEYEGAFSLDMESCYSKEDEILETVLNYVKHEFCLCGVRVCHIKDDGSLSVEDVSYKFCVD
jgi:hypothetical protein